MPHEIEVLDLFSAAAGGWSLGMHRAGFKTIAACEFIEWRRALYSQNNPGVLIYDDVRTLTADQLVRDLGRLPSVVVGSPPCQDISSANTKGKGVEGERSGLYFEGIRIIGEVRPRWFALENSSNLRTRGADAVLAGLEALGYSCWPFVVRAGDIGANHERPRCWIIGCDIAQVSHSYDNRQYASSFNEQVGELYPLADRAGDAKENRRGSRLPRRRVGAATGAEQQARWDALDTESFRHESRGSWGYGSDGDGSPSVAEGKHADTAQKRPQGLSWGDERREGEISKRSDLSSRSEVGLCQADSFDPAEWSTGWSLHDLTAHIQLDDGLSSWLAGTRIAVGGPKGTSAASLIVEAFGDAVVPQIPEAIGHAILRTEHALSIAYGRAAA